ncbi:MAG: hypothetical protein NZ870_04745, partial [bacterium]|nr:hypothetical protein [bacterium]
KLTKLKLAGLDGILLSINPFILEFINFTHIKTAKEASTYVFGEDKVILYQNMFYELIFSHHIDTKLKFENFLSIYGIQPVSFMELLPMGRAVYKLAFLYKKFQAEKFFSENCIFEFQNPYHIHIDNYGNYIPSFCAGLSLNNIFKTDDIFTVDLKEKPIIKALCQNIEELYYIGKQFDYQLNKEGYISKCHLCVDIRKHIALKTNNFKELSPTEYYYHLLE